MCKILLMSGLKHEDEKKTNLIWQFVIEMGKKMSTGNTDGLGYSAITEDNKLFGERWLNNNEAFIDRYQKPKEIHDYISKFLNLDLKATYNKFGTLNPRISAITLHTRYATSGKGFSNTHPFIDKRTQTSVIHNGVITNVEKEDNIRSTCDSERILNKYIEHGVQFDLSKIQLMADDLSGGYACGVFSKDDNGKFFMDVFRYSSRLHSSFIKELGVFVFTTVDDDLISVCDQLGLTLTFKPVTVKEEIAVRFDAITGEPISMFEFKASSYYSKGNSRNYHRSYPDYNTGYGSPAPSVEETNKILSYEERKRLLTETDFDVKKQTESLENKDILKEKEAESDGYKYSKESGIWTKRKFN